jgi:hypothetical protein
MRVFLPSLPTGPVPAEAMIVSYESIDAMQKYPVPDWLAVRNLDSWRDIVQYYEEFEGDLGSFVSPILRLVRRLSAEETARSFRAGHSLWHLTISTAEQHGLRDDEPFVCVTLADEGRLFQLEYWQRIRGHPMEKQRCSEAEVSLHLDRMLVRLWDATRGRCTA